ncbi:hypothetical protein BDZ90DRAFT_1194 [Jaminaea rosea]|uniref:Uncharacterized protein n=1 Tax=Jaminaea rosea TaxID=1569628 RepID=A0A316V180_9BASI|nr:hypothetical protein BDZ90DRAFT_1194 [Jaminaea rosea]PWN29933.1 hypothetical protein BDZ90DRAFT_1194 [Jaminaea rosea]
MSASTASAPPPPLPTAPRPSSKASEPSHAQFLLEQTRSSLQHLHASGALDVITYRDVELKLSRAVLREPQAASSEASSDPTGIYGERASDSESVKLGKRNAWMRKAIAETSLLPTLVESALNIVGGPFLGDSQIDAIVELVSMSQNKIGEAITNPRNQKAANKAAFSGLKGAGQGVQRGCATAGQNIERRREESRAKTEEKRKEKAQTKELEEELKREREEMRKRTAARSGAAESSEAGQGASAAADEGKAMVSFGVDDASLAQSGSATASVAVTTLGSASSAAVTTFQPFDGFIISSTIVASPQDANAGSETRRRMMAAEGSTSTLPPLVTSPRSLSTASTGTPSIAASTTQQPRTPGAASSETSDAPPLQSLSSISKEDEDRLRMRQPPPLPPASEEQRQTQQQQQQQQPPERSAPLPPPPQHRARPPVGQRTLDESERVEDLAGSASDQHAQGPAGNDDSERGEGAASGDDGAVVDTTESKQRKSGWKSRILG